MDLKFTFGASSPLPLSSAGAGSASAHGSHGGPGAGLSDGHGGPKTGMCELRVRLNADAETLLCEGVSGDGVAYSSAEKKLAGTDLASLATALRSVIARGGAELPDPMLGSVSAITLQLGGREEAALNELGLMVSPGGAILAQIDEALQARTGITAGTPIRRG